MVGMPVAIFKASVTTYGCQMQKKADSAETGSKNQTCAKEATHAFAKGLLSGGTHPHEVTQALIYIAVDLALQTDTSNLVLPSVLLSICSAATNFHRQQATHEADGLDYDELDSTGAVIH